MGFDKDGGVGGMEKTVEAEADSVKAEQRASEVALEAGVVVVMAAAWQGRLALLAGVGWGREGRRGLGWVAR